MYVCMYIYIYIHYAYHPHMPYNCYSIDLHVPTQITKCVQMSEETMFGWWWYLSASNAHFHRGWVSTELRYCFPQVISHKSPIQTVGHTPLKFPSIAGILYEKWLFPRILPAGCMLGTSKLLGHFFVVEIIPNHPAVETPPHWKIGMPPIMAIQED